MLISRPDLPNTAFIYSFESVGIVQGFLSHLRYYERNLSKIIFNARFARFNCRMTKNKLLCSCYFYLKLDYVRNRAYFQNYLRIYVAEVMMEINIIQQLADLTSNVHLINWKKLKFWRFEFKSCFPISSQVERIIVPIQCPLWNQIKGSFTNT